MSGRDRAIATEPGPRHTGPKTGSGRHKERVMKEHKVLEALEALAENDRLSGVPPSVEMRLIQAFRARRPKRAFPSWAAVCSIAAAAGLLTVVTVQHRPWHIPTPK